MGLMKLSTYYKKLGDHVTFFKGNLKDLVLNMEYEKLLAQLYANDKSIFWEEHKPEICEYLKTGKSESLKQIPLSSENEIVKELLKAYRKDYRTEAYFKPEKREWDRIGITTLFTFYWDITIDTINFAKKLCKDENGIMVGGVMASILPDRIEEATGIRPFEGTLSEPGILDKNDLIVDTMPLDYSILEEIDYEYPAQNAYFAYMTRGCINKCKFCAVPKLEPEYKSYVKISHQIDETEKRFGQKKDLLLLDNNVLASKEFDKIVDEIKKAGFVKDSKIIQPNEFEIAIKNLKDGYNDRGYLKKVVKLYHQLFERFQDDTQEVYDLLKEKNLLEDYTAKKEAVFETYDNVKGWFEKMYSFKRPRLRYVDFNQGIDARLINDQNMKKLAEIPVKPVRIAFDHWELHDVYENAVRTAVKHGHKVLSNYILYNFEDKPIELYYRLKLNVDLCDKLGANIYSFPMKYHPIEDPEYFSNRDYIGKEWNRKFIRTIQAILNSTKGKVGRGTSFFYRAFGSDEKEFYKLLYMPEAMIIYRKYFEDEGLTQAWWKCFSSLSSDKLEIAKSIIESNVFDNYSEYIQDEEILELLSYYNISRKDAEKRQY